MTMTMKNTKNEIMNELKNYNLKFNEKMTKQQLFDLLQFQQNAIKNVTQIVEQNLLLNEMHNSLIDEKLNHFNELIEINENCENSQNDENCENLFDNIKNEYCQFLNEQNAIFKYENEIFHINANKKQIFIKLIEIDENIHYHVFTILNNKFSNDMQKNKLFARNILTLKSLKACKSYTISNMK
jgi:hypothetical protein